MKLKNLPNEVAKREGLKSQAKVGDLREAQKHQLNLLAEDFADASIPLKGKLLTQLNEKVMELTARIEYRRRNAK